MEPESTVTPSREPSHGEENAKFNKREEGIDDHSAHDCVSND
jgi:hypothetical protein